MCAENVRRFQVFAHRCLRSIVKDAWSDRVGNVKIGVRVLGTGFEGTLSQLIQLGGLCWLTHALSKSITGLPRGIPFSIYLTE